MDGYLRKNIAAMKHTLTQDDDVFGIIDGGERKGKSVKAQQVAFEVDPTFTEDRMCIDGDEFLDKIKHAKPGQAIVFDEAYLGMAAEDTMSSFNKLIKRVLVTVGQKNLFVIMVLPSFFDLSKYAALHRADFLIHVYTNKGKRGYFTYYSKRKLKKLYILGKKFYEYKLKGDFHGRFYNVYHINEEVYRQKKKNSLNKLTNSMEEDKSKWEIRALKLLSWNVRQGTTRKELAEIIDVNNATLSKWGIA